ncbi:7,8-dihydropteroate synthase [Candidatus Desulfarcum epimagneticum]|uniref:Dihydropteroate synthase n=1 Tax=uncultured Desulfobacteraceae bacterium TaxID=218296 RepID=A0A484HJT7_9BACT|nr:7,8-dihydropteroate synthase [uncultured Desulfobacteraceae bacterium]
MIEKKMEWGAHSLDFGKRTQIMGIVNVTPDSFSDGGRFDSPQKAIDQGLRLADEGADIIDVGGESTRPFSAGVALEEEISRTAPVIEGLARRLSIPISIDTVKSGVAQRALDAGAAMINDISALSADPGMAPLAAERRVPVVLMHMKGSPKTMQMDPSYSDVMAEIVEFLKNAVSRAVEKGIPKSMIIVDPGVGFGKTAAHNLEIIRRLKQMKTLGVPVLMGHSRKSFIQKTLQDFAEKDMNPLLSVVETGTRAVSAAAILNGADIIRVHDAAGAAATARMIDAIIKS